MECFFKNYKLSNNAKKRSYAGKKTTMNSQKHHFLYAGALFVSKQPHIVTTILGSCISVCLWDAFLKIGGINHYQLAFWNGQGLATPKYGNIANEKLIKKMLELGCQKKNITAKIFGGASVLKNTNGSLNIGKQNIFLAKEVLAENNIPIVSSDVDGKQGRKLKFYTETGTVYIKKL